MVHHWFLRLHHYVYLCLRLRAPFVGSLRLPHGCLRLPHHAHTFLPLRVLRFTCPVLYHVARYTRVYWLPRVYHAVYVAAHYGSRSVTFTTVTFVPRLGYAFPFCLRITVGYHGSVRLYHPVGLLVLRYVTYGFRFTTACHTSYHTVLTGSFAVGLVVLPAARFTVAGSGSFWFTRYRLVTQFIHVYAITVMVTHCLLWVTFWFCSSHRAFYTRTHFAVWLHVYALVWLRLHFTGYARLRSLRTRSARSATLRLHTFATVATLPHARLLRLLHLPPRLFTGYAHCTAPHYCGYGCHGLFHALHVTHTGCGYTTLVRSRTLVTPHTLPTAAVTAVRRYPAHASPRVLRFCRLLPHAFGSFLPRLHTFGYAHLRLPVAVPHRSPRVHHTPFCGLPHHGSVTHIYGSGWLQLCRLPHYLILPVTVTHYTCGWFCHHVLVQLFCLYSSLVCGYTHTPFAVYVVGFYVYRWIYVTGYGFDYVCLHAFCLPFTFAVTVTVAFSFARLPTTGLRYTHAFARLRLPRLHTTFLPVTFAHVPAIPLFVCHWRYRFIARTRCRTARLRFGLPLVTCGLRLRLRYVYRLLILRSALDYVYTYVTLLVAIHSFAVTYRTTCLRTRLLLLLPG